VVGMVKVQAVRKTTLLNVRRGRSRIFRVINVRFGADAAHAHPQPELTK